MSAIVGVVTGSSSGVGAATAARFLARGVDVIGVDIVGAEEGIHDMGPGRYIHFTADAGAAEVWPEVLAASNDNFGAAPTLAVFCAAYLAIGSVVSLDEDAWSKVFHVNVFGPARALKVLIPEMTKLGGGAIVFVNSSDGVVAEQNLAAYCASKGAALQLMRAVAIDHARQNIRSNAVCPGSIETPFFMRHVAAAPDPAAFLHDKTDRHPLGTLMQPDQVAATIDFLASSAASGVTGAALAVDGGLTTTFDFYPVQADNERALALRLASSATSSSSPQAR